MSCMIAPKAQELHHDLSLEHLNKVYTFAYFLKPKQLDFGVREKSRGHLNLQIAQVICERSTCYDLYNIVENKKEGNIPKDLQER